MQQDWAAVATAIDTRLAKLNWRQRELAQRAQVSVAIVRELHRNTTQRRRNARTLEALSVALGWHPEHLEALLRGDTPPDRDQPAISPVDPVLAKLTSIDRRLAAIERRLDELASRDD
ncbi:MAG: XRE family transcriptional regulator [Pseudonocardiales bacterium]|nr:XRE family transcriptional regulator [Pseudonocardiales bacterium]